MFFGCFDQYDVVASAFGIFGIFSVALGKTGEIVEQTYMYWESGGVVIAVLSSVRLM